LAQITLRAGTGTAAQHPPKAVAVCPLAQRHRARGIVSALLAELLGELTDANSFLQVAAWTDVPQRALTARADALLRQPHLRRAHVVTHAQFFIGVRGETLDQRCRPWIGILLRGETQATQSAHICNVRLPLRTQILTIHLGDPARDLFANVHDPHLRRRADSARARHGQLDLRPRICRGLAGAGIRDPGGAARGLIIQRFARPVVAVLGDRLDIVELLGARFRAEQTLLQPLQFQRRVFRVELRFRGIDARGEVRLRAQFIAGLRVKISLWCFAAAHIKPFG